MAKFKLSLSAKSDTYGHKQVYVRVTVNRELRLRLQSGVYVHPKWIDESADEIVIPKRGRLNLLEVREAEKAKADLEAYISRLEKVLSSLTPKDMNAETIKEALAMTEGMKAEDINSYSLSVERSKRKKEEEKKKRLVNTLSFYELTEYYIKRKEFSKSYENGFRVLVRMLARYESFVRFTDNKRKDFTLNADTLNTADVEDFFDYVKNEKSLSEEYPELFSSLLTQYPVELSTKHKSPTLEHRGENTILRLKSKLKVFFHWLNTHADETEQPITTNSPCTTMEIGEGKYGDPYYLTLKERNQIADADLHECWQRLDDEAKSNISESSLLALSIQRDIFVFQCLVGCRVSDLLKLRSTDIVDGVLNYVPRKTIGKQPKVVQVPLNARAMALMEKYKGVDKKGRLFPFIAAQNYNNSIKDILTLCGITRMVKVINPKTGEPEMKPLNVIGSSHMARRTFVGTLYEKVQDVAVISSMSGHSEGSRAFARYRKVTMDIKQKHVKMIN